MLPRNHVARMTIRRLLLAILLLCGLGATVTSASRHPSRPSTGPVTATSLAEQYRQAKAYYQEVSQTPALAAARTNWLAAAKNFRKIYLSAQDSDEAPASLFMLARIYRELYRHQQEPLDLGEAIAYNEDVAALYPRHRLADDALFNLVQIYRQERPDPEKEQKVKEQLLKNYPNGDMAPLVAKLTGPGKAPEAPTTKAVAGKIAEPPAAPPAPPPVATTTPVPTTGPGAEPSPAAATVVTQPTAPIAMANLRPVRYWSTSNYTRVVIETSGPVTFKKNLLEKSGNQPRRLYVDLDNCRVASELRKPIPVDDGLLRQIRSGQFTSHKVRVVLDTQSLSDYKVFSLQDPFRIIIDVHGQRAALSSPCPLPPEPGAPTLAQQLGLGIRRIIIDPGHGGKDCGAIGVGGIQEKDITLAVAKEVATRLKSRLNCEVVMTRDSDIFIPLEERTAIANTREGDLFISIHVNAAPNAKARGIETYILDLAKNKNAMLVAARENASSAHQLSDLQSILRDLMQNSKKSESLKLAEFVQESMVTGLKTDFPEVKSLGVKQAPFVVLLGAQMPAILTEIAFLSNPDEASWLVDEKYQGEVAEQIVSGVTDYVKDLCLAAVH